MRASLRSALPSWIPAFMALLSGFALPAQAGLYDVGNPFPIVKLPVLGDSRESTIEEFRGRKVMLHLFASW